MHTTLLISGIDHFVLTVADLEVTLSFYERVLGLERKLEHGKPAALLCGRQKINVHQSDKMFEPKARCPTSGAGDFCLITEHAMGDLIARLDAEAVVIEVGPIQRIGARGEMTSVYFRDPDGNLIEVANYSKAS